MYKSNSSHSSKNFKEVTMNVLRQAGKFAWRHKDKIIAASALLATGGAAVPAIVAAAGLIVGINTFYNNN